jgi:hypothetical protein
MVKNYVIPQQTWADDVTAAITLTHMIRGKVTQISVKINDNDATLTLTISDENAGQLFSKAAIPKNATTVYKATSDATDFNAFICDGKITLLFTPSGDPGANGLEVDVILSCEDCPIP